MPAEFNLQTHLIQMEARILTDIREVGKLAARAQETADELSRDVSILKERVDHLDTSVKYVYRGVWLGIVTLVGFVWNRLTGKI